MKFVFFKAFLLLLCLPGLSVAKSKKAADPVIVTVNNIKITVSQTDALVRRYLAKAATFGQSPSPELIHNLRLRATDEIIERVIINERIRARNIKVTEKELEKEIAKIIEAEDMTVNEFIRKALPANNTNFIEFKEQVLLGLQFDKLIESVGGKDYFKVDDSEARRRYKRQIKEFTKLPTVRARHILIKYPEFNRQSKEDVKYAMGQIAKMVSKGADFAKLAKMYSEDKATRDKGGNLGFFTKQEMYPKLAKVAFSLEEGQVSDVIETPYGCHLVKVEEKKPGGVIKYEEAKKIIVEQIKNEKKDAFAANYIRSLMAKARIKWPGGKRPEPVAVKSPVMEGYRK